MSKCQEIARQFPSEWFGPEETFALLARHPQASRTVQRIVRLPYKIRERLEMGNGSVERRHFRPRNRSNAGKYTERQTEPSLLRASDRGHSSRRLMGS